jgi:hypothetical protein
VPFDLRRERVEGDPVPVLNGVMTQPGSGAAQWAIARDAGTLAFVPGGGDRRSQGARLDRSAGEDHTRRSASASLLQPGPVTGRHSRRDDDLRRDRRRRGLRARKTHADAASRER